MHAVSFDFVAKRIDVLDLAQVQDTIAAGGYCWVDFADLGAAGEFLDAIDIERPTIDRVLRNEHIGEVHLGRNCIHCTLVETACRDGELALDILHIVLGKGFIATVHAQPSALIVRMTETYEDDFYSTAESGGYLLFEIADHLIGGYRATLTALSTQVEDIQKMILGDIGDEILTDVSELTRALLDYRNAVVAARETIHELATRRSVFVKPSTQPFLDRQTTPLARLASDAATERAVLSETLNLYMGIVSHRTNKVVNRLTVVSMIFLPLNFLAAVYGMNFQNMPELGWRLGYLWFWAISAGVTVALLLLLRGRRWF